MQKKIEKEEKIMEEKKKKQREIQNTIMSRTTAKQPLSNRVNFELLSPKIAMAIETLKT